jgi:hypothetical protein
MLFNPVGAVDNRSFSSQNPSQDDCKQPGLTSPELNEVVAILQKYPYPKNRKHHGIQVPPPSMDGKPLIILTSVGIHCVPASTQSVNESANYVPTSLTRIEGYIADGEDVHATTIL